MNEEAFDLAHDAVLLTLLVDLHVLLCLLIALPRFKVGIKVSNAPILGLQIRDNLAKTLIQRHNKEVDETWLRGSNLDLLSITKHAYR